MRRVSASSTRPSGCSTWASLMAGDLGMGDPAGQRRGLQTRRPGAQTGGPGPAVTRGNEPKEGAMHRLMLAGAAVLALAPCLEASDKTRTCRALTEDGTTTIVEQTYELGKFEECLAAVKAKVAETKCTAG